MAFDHWWLSFLAGKDEYERLLPNFMAAAEKAAMSPESLSALVAWRHRPSDFEEAAAMSEQLTAQAHAFIWAFNLPGFGELAEELVTEEGTQIGVPSVGTAPDLRSSDQPQTQSDYHGFA